MYEVQKETLVPGSGTPKYETSSWLFSWEPYTDAHIDCYIIG